MEKDQVKIADLATVERVSAMEQKLDEAAAVLKQLEKALDAYETFEHSYYALESYYGSNQWMSDYEEDVAGRLPADLKRGVLSEDAVYDLITEHKDIMRRMQRAVLNSLNDQPESADPANH